MQIRAYTRTNVKQSLRKGLEIQAGYKIFFWLPFIG